LLRLLPPLTRFAKSPLSSLLGLLNLPVELIEILSVSKNLHSGYWDLRTRLVGRALPTETRLLAKEMLVSKPCWLCVVGKDNVKHIYFKCPAVKEAIRIISGTTGTSIENTPHDLHDPEELSLSI
jgi:hypothetical protein